VALWTALAMGVILPSVGCQVEYAGMTLPSGKYMHDDVQYFPSGPEFPWANTQAATQRARMRAMGIEVPGDAAPTTTQVPAPGGIPGVQNQFGRPTDVNAGPMGANPNEGQAVPVPPAPGIDNAPADPPVPNNIPAPPPPGDNP